VQAFVAGDAKVVVLFDISPGPGGGRARRNIGLAAQQPGGLDLTRDERLPI
jgi:hypothetical protein